jgi:hypothetical protein
MKAERANSAWESVISCSPQGQEVALRHLPQRCRAARETNGPFGHAGTTYWLLTSTGSTDTIRTIGERKIELVLSCTSEGASTRQSSQGKSCPERGRRTAPPVGSCAEHYSRTRVGAPELLRSGREVSKASF